MRYNVRVRLLVHPSLPQQPGRFKNSNELAKVSRELTSRRRSRRN